jgi:hypothetical protein
MFFKIKCIVYTINNMIVTKGDIRKGVAEYRRGTAIKKTMKSHSSLMDHATKIGASGFIKATGKGRKAKMSAADRKTNQKKYRQANKAKTNRAAKIRRMRKKGQVGGGKQTAGFNKSFPKFF